MEKKEETKDVYITYEQIHNDIIKDDLVYSLSASICHHIKHFIDVCELFNIDLSLILSYCANGSACIHNKITEYLKKCNRDDIYIYRSISFTNMKDPEYYANSDIRKRVAYHNFLRLAIAYSYYWTDRDPCSFETLLDHTIVPYGGRYDFIYLPFKQSITIFFNKHSQKVYVKIPTIEENKIKKSSFWKRLFHKEKFDKEFRMYVKEYNPTINIKF